MDLSNNRLQEVSADTMGHLHKLKSLDLSMNRIKSFAASTLEESRGLQVLNLSHNALTMLQASTLHRQENLQVQDILIFSILLFLLFFSLIISSYFFRFSTSVTIALFPSLRPCCRRQKWRFSKWLSTIFRRFL